MEAKLKPSGFLVAALLAICVWNAAGALHQNFHWPLLVEDDWTLLSRNLIHAKDVLNKLPDRHIEYRTEDASDTYDGAAYYRLQSIVAPTILQREAVEDRYVLVEFWTTRKVMPLEGLTLVEDFGQGFGLYRRP